MLVPRGVPTVSIWRYWEWQEDRRDAWVLEVFKFQTAFVVASMDGVRCGQSFRGVKIMAAFLEEMKDVRGSACREKRETDCRYSPCTRQGSVEAESGQIGGDGDDEYRSSGMMLADNKWVLK